MNEIAIDTKIYLGAALLFPLLTALVCAVVFFGGDAWQRLQARRMRRHIEELEQYADLWDAAEENYPGCYTEEARAHRAALEAERAKLEAYEKHSSPKAVTPLEEISWPRN